MANDRSTQELQSWGPASADPRPAPHAEKAEGKSKRRSKRLWLGAAVLGCAGVGAYVLFARGEPASAALPAADVPRTQGRKIVFSDKFRERLGVKFAEAKQAPLTPVVSAVGIVDFDPEHVAAVGTRLRGLVRKVKKFEGDEVNEGDLLAEIDSPVLGEAQAEVTSLRAQRSAAASNTDRERELSEKNLSTEREYEVAEAQLKEYSALLNAAQQKVAALGGAAVKEGGGHTGLGVHQLRAPLKGTVVERHVFPGQSVEGHLVAFKVANLDRVWVELAVFDRNLPGISLNDRVEISPLHRTTEQIVGRVARIGAQIDPQTRSASVRIEIDNHARKLRPGQSVNAKIHASATTDHASVIVPSKALSYIDGKPVVFVAEGPNAVTVNDVELGESNGPEQQIRSGVKVGQKVVTDGVFALKSELFR